MSEALFIVLSLTEGSPAIVTQRIDISLCAIGFLVYYSLPNPIFVSKPGWLMETIAAEYARKLGSLFLLWLLFAVVPFLLGLMLKKGVVEVGPDDQLEAQT